MNIIYILIPVTLLLGLFFIVLFILNSLDGQYDDLDTPAHRILIED